MNRSCKLLVKLPRFLLKWQLQITCNMTRISGKMKAEELPWMTRISGKMRAERLLWLTKISAKIRAEDWV